MKFSTLLEELLTELSPQEIYDKYYQKDFSETDWRWIVHFDPKTVTSDDGTVIKRLGKHSKLLLHLYRSNKLKKEDLPKAHEYLEYVYKHQVPLDAKKINSLGDIYKLIEKYIATDSTDLSKIMETLDEGKDYDLLFDGENWFILTPHNEKSACRLGVGTQWCTTWGPYSLDPKHRDRGNYFQHYNKSGRLYIIVNKQNTDEKYQFHFPTEQFMNKQDVQIRIHDFFRNRQEVKFFFFPSLKSEEIEPGHWELEHFSVLPGDDAAAIVKKYTRGRSNELAEAVINIDEEKINELIIDENLDGAIKIASYDYSILLTTDKIPREVQGVSDRLNWLESDLHSSADRLYEMAHEDIKYNEHYRDTMREFFREYYNKNTEFINYNLRARSYKEFEEQYFDDFENSDEIQGEFIDAIVEKSEPDYITAYETEINDIKKHIEIDNYSNVVTIKGPYFLKYVIDHEIEQIIDLGEFLTEYVNIYNLPEDYYDQPEYYTTFPEYKDMENKMDNFFIDIADNFDDEYQAQCNQYKEKFKQIYQSLFKNNNTLENEHVKITIPNAVVNCDNGTVFIRYINKDTNQTYHGEVKIDSLGTYAQNYTLFEEYMSFKNIIK